VRFWAESQVRTTAEATATTASVQAMTRRQ